MRFGIRSTVVAIAILAASRARAGGFQLDEQSARGTATVGAQSAVADDAAALYYNPAGLAYQRGLGAMAGAHFLLTAVAVKSSGINNPVGGLKPAPVLYLTQRIDSRFAVGVGVFSNFLDRLDTPGSWPGRTGSTGFVLSTTTINPSVAIRPIPRVAIGFGLDVLVGEMSFSRTNSTNGSLHSEMNAIGFGGNVGLLAIAVPRWLTLGASYRSAVDLDFSGVGNTNGTDSPLDASGTLPLPHNFSFGASSRPIDRLTVSLDAKLTLWDSLQALTVSFVDPHGDPMAVPTKDTTDLKLRDSFGFRLGGEYRPSDTFWLALGVGYDRTPVRRGWLVPLLPDNDRVLVGFGMGGRYKWLELGAAYSVQVVTARTSTNPVPGQASYSGARHVLTLTAGARFPRLLEKKIAPGY